MENKKGLSLADGGDEPPLPVSRSLSRRLGDESRMESKQSNENVCAEDSKKSLDVENPSFVSYETGRGGKGKDKEEEGNDPPLVIEAFRVPTKEERIRQKYEERIRMAPLVEGRTLPPPSASSQQNQSSTSPSRSKTTLLFFFLIFVALLAVIIIPSVLLTRTRGDNNNNQSNTGIANDRGANITTFVPSQSPSTFMPSSSPSTSAPTSTAFQQVVQLLGFSDTDMIPTDANNFIFQSIDWMAHQDQITPSLISQSTSSSSSPQQQRDAALQRFAMVSLYFATDGDISWNEPLNFLTTTQHECDWQVFDREQFLEGASVNCFDQTVVSIALPQNNLQGFIPETLALLSDLTWLELTDNSIGGTIPSQLANLSRLEVIDFDFNRLTGSIPTQLTTIETLSELWLARNRLTGSIPENIGDLSNLSYLEVGTNFLTGSIPSSIQNMLDLTLLSVEFNMLTSNMPPELNILDGLTRYEVGGNMLTGSLPFQPGSHPLLERFGCIFNMLSGNLSPLGSLTSLVNVQLHVNQFTGTIPTEICTFPLLIFASRNNMLTGSIPNCLDKLANLRGIFLGNNNLSGSIPNLPRSIRELSLNNNDFSGIHPFLQPLGNLTFLSLSRNDNFTATTIPPALYSLTRLTTLRLPGTNLTGTIPTEIGMLTSLVDLRLSFNSFFDIIPTEIGLLSDLRILSLVRCGIEGPLPSELGQLSNLETFITQANDLTGTVPRTFANLTRLRVLSLQNTNVTDNVDFLCNAMLPLERFNAFCERLSNCDCCTSCCDARRINDTCVQQMDDF